MKADEQEIREVHATWIRAVNAGDLVCLLTLMADDVVFLNLGQAPFSRDGFSTHFSAALQRVQVHCISDLEEVVIGGDIAYTWSRDSLSATRLADGNKTRFAGDRITIYRKQPDGRWLLARDAHTLAPVSEVKS
jgi:uncharacterized protein (TIGR02246 family)